MALDQPWKEGFASTTVATWPVGLQKCIDANSFAASEDPQYLISNVNYGPPKSRRVVTRAYQKLTVSIMVNIADYENYMAWWNNNIGGGAGAFYFDHPITKVQKKYKHEKPYQITPIGPLHWRITMNWLEVG